MSLFRRPRTFAEYMAAPASRARRDYVRALRGRYDLARALALMAALAERGEMRRAENLRLMYAPDAPSFYLPPEGGDATPH